MQEVNPSDEPVPVRSPADFPRSSRRKRLALRAEEKTKKRCHPRRASQSEAREGDPEMSEPCGTEVSRRKPIARRARRTLPGFPSLVSRWRALLAGNDTPLVLRRAAPTSFLSALSQRASPRPSRAGDRGRAAARTRFSPSHFGRGQGAGRRTHIASRESHRAKKTGASRRRKSKETVSSLASLAKRGEGRGPRNVRTVRY